MVDAAGTTKYTYYAGGLPNTEDGPWASDTVPYTYNNRLLASLSLQQPTGSWTNGYTWDAGHRLSTETSPAGTFTYTYRDSQPSTLVKKLALPNTSYITNSYDTVARLTGTYLDNISNTVLDKNEYLYNAGNQRIRLTRTDGSYYTSNYDNIGQLTWADSTVSTEDRGYLYDAAWNLNHRTNNGVSTTFTVDSKNQLTGGPTGSYAYDDNGNLTSSSSGYVTYTYDAENQLLTWQNYNTAKTDYVYDGRGRLRKRLEYTWMGSPYNQWSSPTETRYVYDGMRVIQERNSGNTPTVSYTRGMDLSGTFEGAGGIGGLLARSHGYSSGTWSGHNFYHADGNGNVTMLIDNAGTPNVTATYRYDPYGNSITATGTNAANNVYRFSSKERHANSGMYYYGYRFYDPNLQRWINRDPIGELGFQVLHEGEGSVTGSSGPNLYTFVGNQPVSAMDPFGLSLWLCTSRAFGIIGISHAYMWDDRKETPKGQRDCSMQGSSGKRNTHDDSLKGPKPGLEPGWDIWYGEPDSGVSCERIPNSNGKERDAIQCCRDKANKGVWFPGLNDCHNPLDKCLKDAGISPGDIPPHKRFGKNRGVE